MFLLKIRLINRWAMERILAISCLLISLVPQLWTSRACADSIDDAGLWNALFARGDFEALGLKNDRLKWWFDGQIRFLDDAGGFNQSLVRPGIGWTLNERSTVWAGYGWIRTSKPSRLEFDEHRIWQQWTWSKSDEVWKVGLRSRFEQRFVELGDDVGLRFRQLFSVRRKLPGLPRMTVVCWDELFYNLNDTDWGAESGFNQNRAFVGVGYKHSKHSPWRVEIGYLNQVLHNPFGSDRNHHILSLNLFRSP